MAEVLTQEELKAEWNQDEQRVKDARLNTIRKLKELGKPLVSNGELTKFEVGSLGDILQRRIIFYNTCLDRAPNNMDENV